MAIPVPRFTVHSSAREPGDGVWFATPAGFLDLRLDAFTAPPDSPLARSTAEALASVLGTTPDPALQEAFVGQLATARQMLGALRSEGASHCSLGLHRDDTGGSGKMPLLSLLTVTWVDTVWAPRGITVGRAVAAVDGHINIEYAELPCGPVTFSEMLRTPAQESGLPRNPLLQVHAHLAHPDGRTLVLLTLSTTAVAHHEHYRAILRQIAEMASFDDPFAPAVPEAADKRS
ncbi:hypothetical protein OHB54_28310 [Streptomyces sp. NBC_01007]|nr:hypothetical protein OHB54_28310 [Streptomyces sp. NBC_01007]